MAAPAEVTWVKTDSSGDKILKIGGHRRGFFGKSDWELSEEQAIQLIQQDEWNFYVDCGDTKGWLDVQEAPDGSKSLDVDGPIQRLM